MNRLEKNYLDALINDKGPDAVMKAIKDLEAADGVQVKAGGSTINKILALLLTITFPIWLLPMAVIFFMVAEARDTYNEILNQLEKRSKK